MSTALSELRSDDGRRRATRDDFGQTGWRLDEREDSESPWERRARHRSYDEATAWIERTRR